MQNISLKLQCLFFVKDNVIWRFDLTKFGNHFEKSIAAFKGLKTSTRYVLNVNMS